MQNPNPDRIEALIESLTPASLFGYYRIPFPVNLHAWVFGWVSHPELDPVAPPGIARVDWMFSRLMGRRMYTLGYLYALYQEGDFPQRATLGKILQEYSPVDELMRKKPLARLVLREPSA